MDTQLFEVLNEILPSHIHLVVGENEVEPTNPTIPLGPPDASIYDKTIWSVIFLALPPDWDYTEPYPLTDEWPPEYLWL